MKKDHKDFIEELNKLCKRYGIKMASEETHQKLKEQCDKNLQRLKAAQEELDKLIDKDWPYGNSRFTPRENQVLDAALDGLSVGETATKLNVSQADIKMFRASLKRKTGLGMVQHIAKIRDLERIISHLVQFPYSDI